MTTAAKIRERLMEVVTEYEAMVPTDTQAPVALVRSGRISGLKLAIKIIDEMAKEGP